MSAISFNPRWKEELVAGSRDGVLIFEITMGTLHVYFPDSTRWQATAPEWAKAKWEIYSEACSAWCKQNKIPITFTDNAFMYEEKATG